MTVMSNKSAGALTFDTNSRSKEPFSRGENQVRSRIRCVRLVPLDANVYEPPAELLSAEADLICRPSGQNGLVCEKRDKFPINDTIGWILQGGVLSSSAVICV